MTTQQGPRTGRRLAPFAAVTVLFASSIMLAPLDRAEAAQASGKSSAAMTATEAKRGRPGKKPGRSKKPAKKRAPKKAPRRTEASVPSYSPQTFVSERVAKVLSELKSRPLRAAGLPSSLSEVKSSPKKNDWLSSVYAQNMVEASWASEMLSDKLILARVLEAELGSRAVIYYPRTMGLKEFLLKYRLINAQGQLTVDGDRIEEALYEEFPAGFVARPAVGVAPQETGRGLFADTDAFVVELLKPSNALYRPEHLQQPVQSHILGAVSSGEAIVLQEDIVRSSDARKPLKTKIFQEARVHTYEGRVVEGSVPDRWVQTNLLDSSQLKKAEAFVGDFLKSLPMNLLTRLAWGVDVAVLDNGEMRVIDVVTNRGRQIQWSSYLEQPRVIGAYARHFETYYGLKFSGLSGALIRYNFANYMPYWEKRIEKAKPGLPKMLAYLPPVP